MRVPKKKHSLELRWGVEHHFVVFVAVLLQSLLSQYQVFVAVNFAAKMTGYLDETATAALQDSVLRQLTSRYVEMACNTKSGSG